MWLIITFTCSVMIHECTVRKTEYPTLATCEAAYERISNRLLDSGRIKRYVALDCRKVDSPEISG